MVPIDGGVTGFSCRPIERHWRPAGWEVRQLLTFAYGVENVSRLVVAGWCFDYGSMLLTSFCLCFVHSSPELFNTFAAYCCPKQTVGRKEQKVVLFALRKMCCWCRDWRPSEPHICRETLQRFCSLCCPERRLNADLPLLFLVGEPSTYTNIPDFYLTFMEQNAYILFSEPH